MIAASGLIVRRETDVEVPIEHDDDMKPQAEATTGTKRDIEFKQAELKEYQDLFELVPCLITVQDRDYRLINYNRLFADKFDPKPGDFCFHAYKGRDRKCETCPVEKTFRDGQIHRSEETGPNKDGTMSTWIVVSAPIRDDSGEIVSAMEINLDITERRLLEQEAEKSEQKYRAIFNNIPNPVFVLDAGTLEVLDFNDSVEQVYGYSKGELHRISFLELHAPGEREASARRLKSAEVINQVRHRHGSGRWIYVNIRVSPSEYNGKKVLIVTSSDITKRLETESQLAQASKLATLGEMATGVAHELNQPLSVIKTVSSFFMKKIASGKTIDTDTLHSMLSKVDSNVDRATKIITHMRLFARKSEAQLGRVGVTDVLDRVLDIFSQQLKARGIVIEKNYSAGLPSILADPDRLEQVFINLIINARDAIEERWEGRECGSGDKKISINARARGRVVFVEVRDTGTGIPAAVRDKIFDPFFTTKKVGKGTGLGLSISYGIVRDCGGDIRVPSGDGQGACFVLQFPAAEGDDERLR